MGSRPDALVTVDLAVGTPSERTAAQVLRRVLLDAGVDSAAISGVDALDAVVSYGVGYYNTESETRAKDVLEIVAASVHGYVIAKRDGTFAMARLSAAGQSKTTFGVSDLLDLKRAHTHHRADRRHTGLPGQCPLSTQLDASRGRGNRPLKRQRSQT